MTARLTSSTALSKVWHTAAELAALRLPGLPSSKKRIIELAKRQAWQERRNLDDAPLARRRQGRGGGWEYHYTLLPDAAAAKLVHDERTAKLAAAAPAGESAGAGRPSASWELQDWYRRQPETKKREARRRVAILEAVETLHRTGLTKNHAVAEVAKQEGIGGSTIYQWQRLVRGLDRLDREAALCPRHKGKAGQTVECSPEAWEMLKGLWLINSQPPFEECYREVQAAAQQHGWTLPHPRTMRRRIEALWPPLVTYCRQGADALRAMYQPQIRDRSQLRALEAVNADFHTFDITVAMPGAEQGARPSLIVIQDLYSNKILAWRVDLNPSAAAVRLAFHDVFRDFGVPETAVLDNGREFASKLITGGQKTRYRNKIKPEELEGLLTGFGMTVRWTTPCSGQSKPVERGFGDLTNIVSKAKVFDGAYTGRSPQHKPANYGSRVVDFETFLKFVARGIASYNAREGRRTPVCGGVKSFDQAFAESYARQENSIGIRKPAAEQLTRALMTAELLTARKPSGAVHVLGNVYWAEWMTGFVGKKLTVRYDPDDAQGGIEVYRHDGVFLGHVEVWERTGFLDQEKAREHGRKRRSYQKKQSEIAELERGMAVEEVLEHLVELDPPPAPDAKVVRPVRTRGALALQPAANSEAIEEMDRNLSASIAELAAFRRQQP
ncbi:Mu DNA-binding domain-containing protein [Tistlia consotensis]|uniref:Mu DNA-binding domain-containing protein n=1 Tax=Tistlia consotensis USBA 355 TaxID=560819 RepID=A0A1Y6CRH1_9PROT|nr:transposase domain-containing protein [Tistlia consotensis]SMF82855.1 Mu DNA-binding domain-containing protein [Tistlia consotensis USBA 355]SNS31151.1 Mu DNA-binding domain-containing protein [Tistlia consotensis]